MTRERGEKPAWCMEHQDFAWLYDDGSGHCFYEQIVEGSGTDCRLKPLKALRDRKTGALRRRATP